MLIAQCGLAGLVVAGDFPSSFLDGLPGTGPSVPAIDQPVQPGDQMRRFDPERVPLDLPDNPYLSPDQKIPSQLEFSLIQPDGGAGQVLLNGTIAGGDASRLSRWLTSSAGDTAGFVLNSPGGDVSEALEIGRMLRASELPVTVPANAICFSACPYILAGGLERKVSRQASVGVHQHYFGENTYLPAFLLVSDIQSGQAQVMTYLDEMGIDPLLMAKALMTPPDDIYILVPEELESFKLATSLRD
ncbi:MAG TPA: hypothetical protein VK146_12605 [Tabrizicola sp.]|nr:hypothetical protein [Tabrizicola sp.]